MLFNMFFYTILCTLIEVIALGYKGDGWKIVVYHPDHVTNV